MEIRNLLAFIQVASTQNFTQSAHILKYSQSNISMQIQQLEKEIGVKLFDRIGHRVTLTQYGQELLPYAQEIVSTSLKMQNILHSENNLGGVLKVGMVESLFNIIFKNTIEKYHARFPNVKVELNVDGAASIQELVKKNQIDIACLIDSTMAKSNLNLIYSFPFKIVVVSNPHSHTALSKNINDISNEEFILMEESASYSVSFQNWAASKNIEPKIFLKLQNADMAKNLVETGNYLSVLPLYTVSRSVANGSLKIIDIPEFNLIQYIQIATYKPKVITPQIRGFAEEIKNSLELVL